MEDKGRSATEPNSLAATPSALVRHPLPTLAYDVATLSIVAANPAAAEVTGRAIETLVTMSLPELADLAEPLALELHSTGPGDDGLGVVCLLPPRDDSFRSMVEKSAEGLAITDANGNLRYINPAVADMLGRRPQDLIGRFGDLDMHPDDTREAGPAFAALRAAPGSWLRRVSRHRHVDGSYRLLEATVRNLIDDGAIRGFLSSFRDVTARVQAEEALREAKARLDRLLTSTSTVTYSTAGTGADLRLTYVSENVEAILGYQARDLIQNPSLWSDAIHPDDRHEVLSRAAHVMDGNVHVVEYRFRRPDGTFRWMRDELARSTSPAGSVEAIGTWTDVTGRRDPEDALRRSEAGFRMLIDHLPSAVFVLRGTTVIYANVAMTRLLGFDDATEIVGRCAFDFIAEEHKAMVRRRYASLDAQPYNGVAESGLRGRDGKTIPIEAESLRIAYDGAPATVVVARDLTERRELLARMAATDRMLSMATLAAGVAHEINNPLAYVLTNIALVEAALPSLGAESPEARECVGQLLRDAHEGAGRVRDVVKDLRTLSRDDDIAADEGADLHAVLETSIRMADNEIRHRARVVRALEPVPRLCASASRVGQVCLNLLLNAAHAIPDGNAALNEIRVACRVVPDGRVEIAIADTGAGIPSDVIGRVFEPFFTTKPVGMGTGLGLAISHGIVQSLGGTIAVESTPGKGSTFRVVLPAQRGAEIAESPSVSRGLGRLRILVIDDDARVAAALSRLLAVDGHHVAIATSAEEALSRLGRGEAYDVGFCDLMMPNVNGIELYERLGRVAPALARRVAFVTGGAFTAKAKEFLASNSTRVLSKPFEVQDVREMLAVLTRD